MNADRSALWLISIIALPLAIAVFIFGLGSVATAAAFVAKVLSVAVKSAKGLMIVGLGVVGCALALFRPRGLDGHDG